LTLKRRLTATSLSREKRQVAALPNIVQAYWSAYFLTCVRVEREQVFFQGDFHVASSSHFFFMAA